MQNDNSGVVGWLLVAMAAIPLFLILPLIRRRRMRASKVEWDAGNLAVYHELLPPSGKRVCLYIYPPAVGRATISNGPIPADGYGIVLQPGQPPLHLTVEIEGEVVQQPWNVLYAPGSSPLGFIQTLS